MRDDKRVLALEDVHGAALREGSCTTTPRCPTMVDIAIATATIADDELDELARGRQPLRRAWLAA